MNETAIATARNISDRRLAALRTNGDDARRTVAWREAIAERGQIERSAAFAGFKARAAMAVSITSIALDVLGLETLETQGSDRLDFKEQSAHSIKTALIAAYNAGRSSK